MRFDLELFIYNLASRCINLFIIKYIKLIKVFSHYFRDIQYNPVRGSTPMSSCQKKEATQGGVDKLEGLVSWLNKISLQEVWAFCGQRKKRGKYEILSIGSVYKSEPSPRNQTSCTIPYHYMGVINKQNDSGLHVDGRVVSIASLNEGESGKNPTVAI